MRGEDTAWGERFWVCNCPVCRGIVKPLFRRLIPSKKPSIGGEEQVEEVETVSSEEERKGADVEELKELVEALKDSILELKATISDISSPFNKMKQPSNEEEEEEHEVAPISASPRIVYPEKAPAPPITEEKVTREEYGEKRIEKPELRKTTIEKTEEKKEAIEKTMPKELVKEKKHGYKGPTDLKRALKMMRMMYKLSEKVPGEHIQQYLRLLKTLGLLDEKTSETIEVLTKIVEEGSEKGMSPEDQMIAIYSLAKMIGVEDPDLEEEMTMLMIEKLKPKGGSGSWVPPQP